jgi:lipid-A-disaccharide synthase
MPRRVFITVAEVSGDKHAGQLIRSLRQIDPHIIIEGHGGPEMAAAGATIYRDTVTRAAMGWRGALRAVEVYKALRWTRRHFREHRPDLQIGVDSPSMNFHFSRTAKRLGVPTLQYVAPQLWAWAPWRMGKVRKWLDEVACILPFEEAYFRSHGVHARFVGHPLFDQLSGDFEMRSCATEAHAPIVGLLPGSRRSEAVANFPGLLEAGQHIKKKLAGSRFLVPTTAATHDVVASLLKGSPLDPIDVRQDAFDDMIRRCDLCLVVSGTATLHVAALGAPMIVVYRISRLLWNLVGRWLLRTRTFALVNLLAASSPKQADRSRHLVPEFVPWYGDGIRLAELAVDYLTHPEKLHGQRSRLADLIHSLNKPGASMKVARLAIQMMNQAPATENGGRLVGELSSP